MGEEADKFQDDAGPRPPVKRVDSGARAKHQVLPSMSQTGHGDLEGGRDPGLDDHRDQPQPNQPSRPSQGESDYGDTSWPLYFMYSKISEEEDNKVVEHCQRDKDGILIFSGLFSATVGALLTISIPDLKPNSQDTSSFYLENIYGVLGNPNVSNSSTPSTLTKPPAFSPPKYAIWVNSLWFLSLAVSLSGALVATQIRNWTVQYISLTQWPSDTLAKRARIRALFAKGKWGPEAVLGTGNEPIYLHLSLLLFVTGALIYLFNINRSVFYAVVWWVGYATIQYAHGSVIPFFKPHSLFHTPLSPLALRIYLGISYVAFQVCSCIPPLHGLCEDTRKRYRDLSNRYSKGFLIGKRREAEEIASKPSSEIDALILERILPTLDEDHALETFFDGIPGFCNSKLSIVPLSFRVQMELRRALDCFLDRTFSSNLVSESVRASRLITCLNAAHAALGSYAVSGILDHVLNGHRDHEALKSVEIGHALSLWGHGRDCDLNIRRIVACIIARVQRRDERWTMLVKETLGVPDGVLRDYLTHGDSVILSIFIHISRQANRDGIWTSWTSEILSSLSKFDIHNTLPGLQHDFCTLWNEIVQEARNGGSHSTSLKIIREVRHLYVALHQGVDATSTPFSASLNSLDSILDQPSSYPLCNVAGHRPDSTTHMSSTIPHPTQPGDSLYSLPHQPALGHGTALRLAEETNIIAGLPSPHDPSITSEIGETTRSTTVTFPIRSSSPLSDDSPRSGVATAQPDTTSVMKLSHPLESDERQGLAAPHGVAPTDISVILSTVGTAVPVPASTPPGLHKSSATYDASPAFIPKSPFLVSFGSFSSPDSALPLHVPPSPNAELPSLSGVPPTGLPDIAVLPCLRASGLVNDGNKCLANAVLHLLAYCPPFRDLFRDLGRLVGRREGGETGGGATPLIDATIGFLEKFTHKEMPSLTRQFLREATRGKARVGEEDKEEGGGVDPFLPTYVYDAMKEKRQFINARDGQELDATELLRLYLEALDEELVALHTPMSTDKLASTLGLEEDAQSGEGQNEVARRGYTAGSAMSPISRIFDGRSRSTIHAPNQPDVITVQNWRLLELDIQSDSANTVEDALSRISQPQALQVGQLSSSEASQQVQIEVLPSIFVLHLKLLYDVAADGTIKIGKSIQFAPELDIPLKIMALVAGESAEPVNYKLYGLLSHNGESAGSGNYTVEVLDSNEDSNGGETWLHIYNDVVSVVQHEDVFRGRDNERRVTYMLFYCRTASART